MLAQFSTLCPPHTVFTTNPSPLVPSQFARASGRPERLIALHFPPPVWTSRIADVMPHKRTAPDVTALTLDFARRLEAYVDRGHLGAKSGQGFYRYPDPAYARPGFLDGTHA